jgi:hypothetical protein
LQRDDAAAQLRDLDTLVVAIGGVLGEKGNASMKKFAEQLRKIAAGDKPDPVAEEKANAAAHVKALRKG